MFLESNLRLLSAGLIAFLRKKHGFKNYWYIKRNLKFLSFREGMKNYASSPMASMKLISMMK